MKTKYKFNLKIRTILGLIAAFFIALPIVAFAILNIYQSELIKQTESELIAQATVTNEFIKSLPVFLNRNYLDSECTKILSLTESYENKFAQTQKSVDSNDNLREILLPAINLKSVELQAPFDNTSIRPWKLSPNDLSMHFQLSETISSAAARLLSGIRVLNSRGLVISSSNEEALGHYLGDNLEFIAAKSGLTGSVLRRRNSDNKSYSIDSISRNSNIRVFFTSPILINEYFCGTVIASRTPQSVLQALFPSREQIIIGTMAVVLISFFMIRFLITALKNPLEELSKKALSIKNGNDLQPFLDKKFLVSEIDSLGSSLDEMSKNLRERNRALQYFTSHISHELKTPLTSLLGASEILQSHPDLATSNEAKNFLRMISQDAHKIQNMVKDLSRYSKIDFLSIKSLLSSKISLIDLKDILCENFSMALDQIYFDGFDLNVGIFVPKDIVIPILDQLIQNAIKHHKSSNRIKIYFKIRQEHAQRTICFFVENNGPIIPQQFVEKIFDPFFTTDSKSGGTGMGLPIARKLADLATGSLNLYQNSLDAIIFSFELPLE